LLQITKHVLRILGIVLLGGILGAALVRVSPGFGIDERELDSRLNEESIRALRASQANDSNFVIFCVHHFGRLLRGDLGMSRTFQQPVTKLLRERFPETAKGVSQGLIFGWSLGLGMAVLVVTSRSMGMDLIASICAGLLMCLPASVLGLLFVLARAPARLVLALVILPNVFRYSRNLLMQSAARPHVLLAHAKGLGRLRTVVRHILLPIAPQLLALAGVSVSLALTAAIPVEALCDLPGIGQLAWKAALGRDLYLLINLTMIVTLVTSLANSASEFFGYALRGRVA
jgi:peptide/nickel transport system permease protein